VPQSSLHTRVAFCRFCATRALISGFSSGAFDSLSTSFIVIRSSLSAERQERKRIALHCTASHCTACAHRSPPCACLNAETPRRSCRGGAGIPAARLWVSVCLAPSGLRFALRCCEFPAFHSHHHQRSSPFTFIEGSIDALIPSFL